MKTKARILLVAIPALALAAWTSAPAYHEQHGKTAAKPCLLMGAGYYWTDYDAYGALGHVPRHAAFGEVPGIFVGNVQYPTRTEPLNQAALGYMVFGDCDLPANARAVNWRLSVYVEKPVPGHRSAVTVAKSETSRPAVEAKDPAYLDRNIYKLGRNMTFSGYNFQQMFRDGRYANYWGGLVERDWEGLSRAGWQSLHIPLAEEYDRYLTGVEPVGEHALAYRYATGVDKVWLGMFTNNNAAVARFIGYGEMNAPELELIYACKSGYTFDPRNPSACISTRVVECMGSGEIAFFDADTNAAYKRETHQYGPFSVLVCRSASGAGFRCESKAFHDYDFRIDWDPSRGDVRAVKIDAAELWVYGYPTLAVRNLLERMEDDRLRGWAREPERYIDSMVRELGDIHCRALAAGAERIRRRGSCPPNSYVGDDQLTCVCRYGYQPSTDKLSCEPVQCGAHGFWDPVAMICRYCPTNARYDQWSGLCQCLPGYVDTNGQCVNPAEVCPYPGARLDPVNMRCACPPGTVYHGPSRTCIAPEEFCPSNSTYDADAQECVCRPGLVHLPELNTCTTEAERDRFYAQRTACGCNMTEFERLTIRDLETPLPHGYHAQLGWCLIYGQDYARAAAAYRLAIEERPADPDLLNDLGVAQFYLGKIEQAQRQWNSALTLDRNHAAANANVKSLERYMAGDLAAEFVTSPMPRFFYCRYPGDWWD